MTAEQHPARPEGGGTGRNLGARLAALSAPAPPARAPAKPRARRQPAAVRDTGKGTPAGRSSARPAPPAEQATAPAAYPERLSITTTVQQLQALRAARVADGIQATARLRALIAAWMDDPKLRERIDRAARDWQ